MMEQVILPILWQTMKVLILHMTPTVSLQAEPVLPIRSLCTTLEREWNAHHMFSSFDKSAQDIDFDNDEEDSSYFDYVSKAIKRGWKKYLDN